ncbi:MAG: AAA family ATPase [Caldilineaceae bacterium SB0661_bin_32]|uniref:AAA family ATPase n=1 Tax=Caldilineaceae bacterium SB0661_bin_32 TaxID=2605255 RepID=A0A6B1D0R6_9CHLR|nr:AAA family ATPase [Caldilineaceae bacterium SB0661_bin_32]
MCEHETTEVRGLHWGGQPDFHVSVSNFGPIESGAVDLRPLTVLVGPSNTGKTYFAVLVYALRRIMGGFRRLPVIDHERRPFFSLDFNLPGEYTFNKEEDIQDFRAKLDAEGRQFTFSDFPINLQDTAWITIGDPYSLGEFIGDELERCFDLESYSDLVRLPASTKMEISLKVSETKQELWKYALCVTDSGLSTGGKIEDIVLLPKGWSAEELGIRRELQQFQQLLEDSLREDAWITSPFLLDSFEKHLASAAGWYGETHYLPAARSGIMQSHRVIASSLVARTTRVGMERFPELPTFSGVMSDFMQKLILLDEDRSSKGSVANAADALERETLAGQIRSNRSMAGGYPEFVYRPRETEEDIRLTRASSMVSELAPVVLFLRGAISPGDMLIIEEPEAHLHPAAQTQMARTLARLVRAGVKVIVTTHSDWLLMEIANLMREGELEEISEKHESVQAESSALLPSEVGVWLFRENDGSSGSTIEEIPFDRSEGIEPEEYEGVAEALYNRSAALQNQFQELAGAAAREQE